MAGRDKKTGRFLAGHTQNKVPEEIRFLRKKRSKQILAKFDSFARMPLNQLKALVEDTSKLSPQEAAMIKFWQELIKNGDVARMKFFFNAYGIPTELKAVAIQEVGKLGLEEEGGENGVLDIDIELTKEQKLKALDIVRRKIESVDYE